METEITKKIRSAIESKLVELDAFVDDELPEYIMVMVANKKTKEQMDDDLSLFLGKNVGKFTTWLLNMLQVEKGSTVKHAGKSSKGEVDKDVRRRSEDEDVLALDAQQQETDEMERDLEGNSPLPRKKDVITNKPEKVNEILIKSKTDTNDRVTAKQVFETQLGDSSKTLVNTKHTKTQSKYDLKSTSSKLSNAEDDDIEYDPQNPSLNVKSVANKVVQPDRSSLQSLPHQANKLMLFKAMDAANKSVLSKQKLEEVYNPTPIKVLASNAGSRNEPKNKYKDYKPSLIAQCKHSVDSGEEEYVPQPFASWNAPNASPPLVLDVEDELVIDDYVPETVGRTVLYDPEVMDTSVTRTMEESLNGVQKLELDVKPVSPHFVVTLDGYDSKSRKRGWSDLSQTETSDREDIENMDTQNSESLVEAPAKKTKSAERCRFWPLCKNGDNCEFHHPTTPCKAFPKCTYGAKCFYIHPNCKFDSLCTRKDCSYTHTSKKEFPISKPPSLPFARTPYPVKFKVLPYSSSSSPQCKFFPHCTAYKCPFFHPKPCRYGTECQSPTCTFTHPPFPSPSQLKWKAESI